MLNWLGDWWNGVELWLTQLWFPFQFALVMAILLPLCLGMAWLIDRLVDRLAAWTSRWRTQETFDDGEADSPGGH